jgi:phage terminase small subunit
MSEQTRDLARIDYLHGMKYREIADKYKVSLSTVKSWKVRYKWQRDNVHTNDDKKSTQTKSKKSMHTKKSTQAKSKEENIVNKKVEEKLSQNMERSIDRMLINDQLNEKQKLFCIYYIKCFNATKAYRKAYGCDYISAMTNGSRLLGNDKIRAEIERLKADKLKGAMLSPQDILQKYIDAAMADITDYMKFGHEKIPMTNKDGSPKLDKDGNPRYYVNNYVVLNNSDEVDASLITEVKEGKDGVSIKLLDKKWALDFLAKYKSLLDAPTQQKLDIERRKMELLEKNANNLDEDVDYVVEGGSDENQEEN